MKKILVVLILALLATGFVFANGEGESTDNAAASDNLQKSLAVDVYALKGSDGQPLLLPMKPKEIPPRPADPDSLPLEDPGHWYDMEYAGWSAQKVNIPDSPKDGAIGKRVIVIINGDHPYLTAYSNGAKQVAAAYDMDITILSPNWDINVQNQMVDEAIVDNPDMIILVPLDAKAAVQQIRKVNQAGIPIIVSNMLPEDEGMKYCIAWVGPDDWGQFRMLARAWADKLGKKGGVAYIRHAPGGSPYFARTYGPISELSSYAPEIKTLDMQAPGFKAEDTMKVVSDWLTRFGDELNGICAADDSAQAIGIAEALKKAGRTDVVVVAAGNSKIGMDAVKSGDIYAITYQSAEADGAIGVKVAADWFNGKEVPPVSYLPKHIITKADVDDYMPAQW